MNLNCPFTSTPQAQTAIFGIDNNLKYFTMYSNLLFTVTTAERLLSLTAVQLPVVNHLILYTLAKTKSEFKRNLATLYPAIKAKLVSFLVCD